MKKPKDLNYYSKRHREIHSNSIEVIKEKNLSQVQNRLALVINGGTGEKYLIDTFDYVLYF
jgi:cell division protein FtsI/penicillin-binding protein 2